MCKKKAYQNQNEKDWRKHKFNAFNLISNHKTLLFQNLMIFGELPSASRSWDVAGDGEEVALLRPDMGSGSGSRCPFLKQDISSLSLDNNLSIYYLLNII